MQKSSRSSHSFVLRLLLSASVAGFAAIASRPVPAIADAPTTQPAPRHAHMQHFGGDDMPDEVIDQTQPNRDKVLGNQLIDPPSTWSVAADTAALPVSVQTCTLLTRTSINNRMGVQEVLPCQSGGALVGFAPPGNRVRMIERSAAPKGPMRASLPPQCLPLAASPSGEMLVCRTSGFGDGNSSRIDIFTLVSGNPAAAPLVSFTPYPSSDSNAKGHDIHFAAALSETRIITCDLNGRIIAWDIASNSVTGVWRVNVGDMDLGMGGSGLNLALSPTGKWLAAASKMGVTFIDTATGHVLGEMPNSSDIPIYDLSCSPTGKTLIARFGDDALLSINVATGDQNRIVALPSNLNNGRLICVNDGFVLAGGQRLIDSNTGAFIPKYQSPEGATIAAVAPGATLLASDTKLSVLHIPDDAIRSALRANPDAALALKPGMSVALDIQLDLSDADKTAVDAAIRRKLTNDGFVIVPSADITVVVRAELGAQHPHVYNTSQFGMPIPGPGGTSITLANKVTRITIQQKGQIIWERKRDNGPANSFRAKQGQSLQDAAQETIQYDPKFLEDILIPPYIAQPEPETPKQPTPTPMPNHRHP